MTFWREKTGECAACLKSSVRIFVEKIYKMGCLEGSGVPVLCIGLWFLKVNVSLVSPGSGGGQPSNQIEASTFCIVIIRCTENFWSPCISLYPIIVRLLVSVSYPNVICFYTKLGRDWLVTCASYVVVTPDPERRRHQSVFRVQALSSAK
jgi:hypothetical protein